MVNLTIFDTFLKYRQTGISGYLMEHLLECDRDDRTSSLTRLKSKLDSRMSHINRALLQLQVKRPLSSTDFSKEVSCLEINQAVFCLRFIKRVKAGHEGWIKRVKAGDEGWKIYPT